MENNKLNNIKSTGFKVPDDYFDNFDDNLMSHLEQTKSIDQVDDPGFKVPDSYFDSIEASILEKLEQPNQGKVISLNSKRRLYYIGGIAASLLLIFTMYLNTTETDTISPEMVESYFTESDLNSYELAQLLDEADLLEDDFNIIENNFNEEQLEDYLLDYTDIESYLE